VAWWSRLRHTLSRAFPPRPFFWPPASSVFIRALFAILIFTVLHWDRIGSGARTIEAPNFDAPFSLLIHSAGRQYVALWRDREIAPSSTLERVGRSDFMLHLPSFCVSCALQSIIIHYGDHGYPSADQRRALASTFNNRCSSNVLPNGESSPIWLSALARAIVADETPTVDDVTGATAVVLTVLAALGVLTAAVCACTASTAVVDRCVADEAAAGAAIANKVVLLPPAPWLAGVVVNGALRKMSVVLIPE
jgi:hypothetical protein